MSSAALFLRAADGFALHAATIGPDQWDDPGLGTWSVRDLVGHTTRAILTVTTYVGEDDPGEITVASAEEYYALARARFGDDEGVARRGVEAGRWLGDDPAGRIRAAVEEARRALEVQPADRVVSVGGLGIPLAEYLRTRLFELAVHSLDIARATGVPHGLPADVLAEAAALGARTAVGAGSGEAVLLALTGRQPLPDAFSVV